MPHAPEYLIEVDVYRGPAGAGAVETLRLSTHGYTTRPDDDPPNTHYVEAIVDPGDFSSSLHGPNRTIGASEAAYGDVTIANVDGIVDGLIDDGVDGRPIRIWRLPRPDARKSEAALVLSARVEGVDGIDAWTTIRLRLYDRRRDLDVALQETLYAGTTTAGGGEDGAAIAEGDEDLKDRVKPILAGHCENVSPVLVNPFDLVYQVHDGPVSSIYAYDGGVGLMPAGDAPTAEDLVEDTVRPGQFRTCLALGLVRLGGAPQFAVTCDVVEGETEAARYPGAIVRRLLSRIGLDGVEDFDGESADALDTLAPYVVGHYFDGAVTALRAVNEVLASVGGYIVPDETERFVVGRIEAPVVDEAVGTISDRMIETESPSILKSEDTDGAVPTLRTVIQWRRNFTVQGINDLGGCVSPTRRQFLEKDFREAATERDEAARAKHRLAPDLELTTHLTRRADAETEAARRQAVYGARRDVIAFPMSAGAASAYPLNATATVVVDRYGYETGRPMRVIGRRAIYRADQVEMTFWG